MCLTLLQCQFPLLYSHPEVTTAICSRAAPSVGKQEAVASQPRLEESPHRLSIIHVLLTLPLEHSSANPSRLILSEEML